MHWLTIAYSMTAAACVTLATVHLVVWFKQPEQRAHLAFALTAILVAAVTPVESLMVRAQTTEQFGTAIRWMHFPGALLAFSLVWFVWLHFRTGRLWLACTACGFRLLTLILNFSFSPNINYREITGLRQVALFGGESVSAAVGVVNPWSLIAQLSNLLLLLYILDASVTLWRRGHRSQRRRAVVVGGSMVFFSLAIGAEVNLILAGFIVSPAFLSFPYLAIVGAMGYELSLDVVQAEQLSVAVKAARDRLEEIVGNVPGIVWESRVEPGSNTRNIVFVSPYVESMLGYSVHEWLSKPGFFRSIVLEEDRERVSREIEAILKARSGGVLRFRWVAKDGRVIWAETHLAVVRDETGETVGLRGVTLDTTDRQEAEERFRLAVEASPNGILLVNGEGQIVLVNAKTEELFGYSREELIGQAVETLVPERFRHGHPVDRKGFFAAPQTRAMGAGRELFARRRNGTEFPVEIGLSPIPRADGVLVLTAVVDISARKQAEKAKNNLAAIVESSDDAILSKTLKGRITSWNAGAEKMYGYSASEMVGQNVSILIPTHLKAELAGILDRLSCGENVDHLETVRVTKDGRLLDVSLTISVIRDEHGKIIGASTIARDISDRKQAIKDLQESEERFRMMADTAPVMVWVSGPDTLCTFFNRPWLDFTGRTLEQEMGNGWAEGVHPEDYQRCLDVYLSAFQARRNFTMEYRLRRADGKYRWVVDTGVPRLLPSGDFAGYIGSCVDISERKRDEQTLQQLTGRLLMLQDEERQRVAAELHDGLGQSLAIIKNRALIGLQDQTNHDRAIDQLGEIAETATAAILEVREIAYNLRPYQLDRLGLVAAIKFMINRVSESTSLNLSADMERIDGLLSPEAETSVYRIVQEGLNNVVKHSSATTARVEIKRDGGKLAISVQDNGKGISPPAQSGNGSNNKAGGGVGLAGIAERVRLLGGSFAIDSQPGRGTTLTVRLELPDAGE